MTKDDVVNSIYRDLKLAGFIAEGKDEHVKWHLSLCWTAGYDERARELTAHHRKRVIQYNRRGGEVATFGSIEEAAKANKMNRDVIDDSISGRTKFTRKRGYYFRYAEHENRSNPNTDTTGEG